MKTRIYKDHYRGWVAESLYLLDEEKQRYLKFTTMKASNGETGTHVRTVVINGNSQVWAMFSDYSKSLDNYTKLRATEKVVTALHTKAVEENLLAIIAEAKAFHLKKGD